MTKVDTQKQQVSSQNRVDPKTCVEFLTYEQCKKRGLENSVYDNDIMTSLRVYIETDKIHPMYLEKLSPEKRSNPDLLAVAPHGFVWKEDRSGTSYYSWDDYYILVKNPYI